MAGEKKSSASVPVNTEPLPASEHPELAGLRESETAFIEKGKRLEAMDPNEQPNRQEAIQANANALANVRKRIQKLSK